jgi:hypothetical protein
MGKAVFSNEYGVLTVENVMYAITLSSSWDTSGTAELRTQFSVRGRIELSTTTFDIEVLAKGGGYAKVGRGELELPHKSYSGARLLNVSAQPGIWVTWGDVVLSLEKLNSDPVDHSITVNTIKILDPKLSITAPAMRRSATHLPMKHRPARQKLGRMMLSIGISGVVEPVDDAVPEKILEYAEENESDKSDRPKTRTLSDLVAIPEEDTDGKAPDATKGAGGDKPDMRMIVFDDASLSLMIESGAWTASLSGSAPSQTLKEPEQT